MIAVVFGNKALAGRQQTWFFLAGLLCWYWNTTQNDMGNETARWELR